ncbi:TetR/AcrR family transcriptional regulator [Nonomuraea sp. NPDC050556]|uniref:TetR/AcrR family transcriptional regulator n=1 Tax=Nonomuraea sp. NPDC050556 TaxID=3364369 RepID=UPI0037B110D5
MRRNVERRAALVDAAIEVLAREGARGLTFRAVDAEAGVPTGTASNYFANRDDMFTQAGGRVYEVLRPQDVPLTGPPTRERLKEIMREVVDRVSTYRSGYLALLELRLEATRRPELRAVLTRTIRADVDANVRGHRESGLPGDDAAVLLLYLALNWLVVERLTLPGLFGEEELNALVDLAVERAVPA